MYEDDEYANGAAAAEYVNGLAAAQYGAAIGAAAQYDGAEYSWPGLAAAKAKMHTNRNCKTRQKIIQQLELEFQMADYYLKSKINETV